MKPPFVLLVLAATALYAQTSHENSASATRVLALENAWGQAEKLGDVKAIEMLLDDNLVYIRYDGEVWTKPRYLTSLGDHASHEDEAVNESMTAHVFDNTVLVTGIYRVKGIEKGRPYSRRERFIDSWTYRDETWKCVASQVTLISH